MDFVPLQLLYNHTERRDSEDLAYGPPFVQYIPRAVYQALLGSSGGASEFYIVNKFYVPTPVARTPLGSTNTISTQAKLSQPPYTNVH